MTVLLLYVAAPPPAEGFLLCLSLKQGGDRQTDMSDKATTLSSIAIKKVSTHFLPAGASLVVVNSLILPPCTFPVE